VGRRVGRGTAGDDLGPPNPAPPPSPLRTDDDPSTKPTCVGLTRVGFLGKAKWEGARGGRARRATIKALPAALHHPRPYGLTSTFPKHLPVRARVGMGDSGWEERYGARLLLEVVFSSCHPCHLLPPEEVFDVFSRLPCRLH